MKSPFVLTISDGHSVLGALVEAGRGGEGWWQAQGFVEDAEVRVATDGADRSQSLPGRYALISLAGAGEGPFVVLLGRTGPGGAFESVGGELLSARSATVTALFIPAGSTSVDVEDPRYFGSEPPTLRGAADRISSPGPNTARAPNSNWAQAALAIRAEQPEEEDDDPQSPERGDLVHHFAFGWCEVLQIVGDRLKIRDTQGTGRVREILIDVLDVSRPEEKDGKRAFKLTRKG